MSTRDKTDLPGRYESLLNLLSSASELLSKCGQDEVASWYCGKADELSELADSQAARGDLLKEIEHTLAGMGSFSDISLVPAANSGLSPDQAREMQWQLTDEIGKAIRREIWWRREKTMGHVTFEMGNIVDQHVDGLVSSGNVELNMSGGVNGELLRRGGHAMQEQLHGYLREHDLKHVEPGFVMKIGPTAPSIPPRHCP